MLSSFASVIFDMDGVLWHSSEVHAEAYRKALSLYSLPCPDYPTIAGRKTDEVMAELTERFGHNRDMRLVSELTRAKRQYAAEMLARAPPLAHSSRDLLVGLKRSGFALALASSASKASVQIFLRALNAPSLFSAVVCGEELTSAKPNPEIYLRVLSLCDFNVEKTVVVEDSLAGVQAAHHAGLPVIGVAGTHDAVDLEAEGVIAVVSDIQHLWDHV